ncbi:MAG: hypothetical protein KDD63_29270 [Bacteroidetes bacterium]|nr:hypothetical protein [Bacteroidota bacterium]MCB0844195.1 hypothetical protein [Bacteroidota bacterium]MCB0856359.1 hypothetical protein [Bacteroidota bacterium]
MTVIEAYKEFADFIANIDPSKIVNLRASEEMAQRVEELVNKKKEEVISAEELVELERYLSLDLFINLAKARAKRLLAA